MDGIDLARKWPSGEQRAVARGCFRISADTIGLDGLHAQVDNMIFILGLGSGISASQPIAVAAESDEAIVRFGVHIVRD